MISILGLVLIIAGWFIQFSRMKKSKEIRKEFVITYAIGVLLLVIDGFRSGIPTLALLNLVSLVGAALVLGKIKK